MLAMAARVEKSKLGHRGLGPLRAALRDHDALRRGVELALRKARAERRRLHEQDDGDLGGES